MSQKSKQSLAAFRPLPQGKNPNRHTQQGLGQLEAAMDRQGYVAPMTAARNGAILDGNARLEKSATKFDGVEPLVVEHDGSRPVIMVRTDIADEDDPLARDIIVSANRVAQVDLDLDPDVLKAFMAEGLDLAPYEFDAGTLTAITGIVDGHTEPDDVPAVRSTNIKHGDLFELGIHRLLCGDATSDNDVARVVDGARRDVLAFTSPPYNAGSAAKLSGNMASSNRGNLYQAYDDAQSQDDWLSLANAATAVMLKHSACAVVNVQMLGGNKMAFIDWLSGWKRHVVDIAIWNKGHAAPHVARNVMASTFEFLVVLSPTDGASKAVPTANFQGTVQSVHTAPGQHENEFADIHGATFPIHLPTWVIQNLGNGQPVLDVFAGTGTTMMAAERLGRRAFGVELDPQYVQCAIDRWEAFTGQKAVKVGSA